jgi:hypothetical protein
MDRLLSWWMVFGMSWRHHLGGSFLRAAEVEGKSRLEAGATTKIRGWHYHRDNKY